MIYSSCYQHTGIFICLNSFEVFLIAANITEMILNYVWQIFRLFLFMTKIYQISNDVSKIDFLRNCNFLIDLFDSLYGF